MVTSVAVIDSFQGSNGRVGSRLPMFPPRYSKGRAADPLPSSLARAPVQPWRAAREWLRFISATTSTRQPVPHGIAEGATAPVGGVFGAAIYSVPAGR